jgi:hypothetical protein
VAVLASLRAREAYIGRCPDVPTAGDLFLESLLLRTLWRGDRVAVPLETVPFGTATLVTRGGPRRHFWLVHDERGLLAFRATVAHPRARDEDVSLLARWTGAGWEGRRVNPISPEYFFNHPFGAFDRDGRLAAGPAARDLDRFPVVATGESAMVDTSTIRYGACRVAVGCDCYP